MFVITITLDNKPPFQKFYTELSSAMGYLRGFLLFRGDNPRVTLKRIGSDF